MNKRFTIPKDIVQSWYFFPLIGVLLFVLINASLFGGLWLLNRPRSEAQVAGSTDQIDPTETPEDSNSDDPQPTSTPSTTPQSSPTNTPRPSATTKATVTPKPTSTPAPTVTPTPFEKEDVRINSPEHKKTYDNESIEISMSVYANQKVKKLEVIIDGDSRHSFTGDQETYKVTLNIDAGGHDLQGKATLEDDSQISSGVLEFGTGGKAWDYNPEATQSGDPS